MNKHSARIRSKNDLRRAQNMFENDKLIPEVIHRVIESTNNQAQYLHDIGEFPVDFYYSLSMAVIRSQKKLGVEPYKIRDSKLRKIIQLLEGTFRESLSAPVADTYTDAVGNIELQMFRA